MPIKNEEKNQWKKGQSGNPNGRPKGKRSRSTIVKKWLEACEKIKNPITGEEELLEQQDIMTLSLIKKARKGDVSAFKELMDSAHGKLKELSSIEQTVTNIEPLTREEVELAKKKIDDQI